MPPSVSQCILDAAKKYGLSPGLIAAVIVTESDGDARAFRYEPSAYAKWIRGKALKQIPAPIKPDDVSLETELQSRAYSWGLMQIMGQVAREQGFTEKMTELLDPAKNVDLGSKILWQHLSKAGNTEEGLLRYNGGGDPTYPKRVIQTLESGSWHFLVTN